MNKTLLLYKTGKPPFQPGVFKNFPCGSCDPFFPLSEEKKRVPPPPSLGPIPQSMACLRMRAAVLTSFLVQPGHLPGTSAPNGTGSSNRPHHCTQRLSQPLPTLTQSPTWSSSHQLLAFHSARLNTPSSSFNPEHGCPMSHGPKVKVPLQAGHYLAPSLLAGPDGPAPLATSRPFLKQTLSAKGLAFPPSTLKV